MKKIIKGTIAAAIAAVFLTGCAKVDMTDKQESEVADYSAKILLKHSYLYKDKYEDLKDPKGYEEVTTTEKETETGSESESESATGETETETKSNVWAVADELKLAPLTVVYDSYDITKEYPKDIDVGFYFEAEPGYTFVVMKFNLTNNTNKDVTVENENIKPVVYGYINSMEYTTANYGNLMQNDISCLKSTTVKAGEKFEGILVFMVEEKLAGNIKSMVVTINNKDYKIE